MNDPLGNLTPPGMPLPLPPDSGNWEEEDGGRFHFLSEGALPPVPPFLNVEKKMPTSVYASTAEKNREKVLEMVKQNAPVLILQEDINRKAAVMESIKNTRRSKKHSQTQQPSATKAGSKVTTMEEKKKRRLSISFKKSNPIVTASAPGAKKVDVDVEEYKKQMKRKYEEEQAENARLLTALKNATPPPPLAPASNLLSAALSTPVCALTPPPAFGAPPPIAVPPPECYEVATEEEIPPPPVLSVPPPTTLPPPPTVNSLPPLSAPLPPPPILSSPSPIVAVPPPLSVPLPMVSAPAPMMTSQSISSHNDPGTGNEGTSPRTTFGQTEDSHSPPAPPGIPENETEEQRKERMAAERRKEWVRKKREETLAKQEEEQKNSTLRAAQQQNTPAQKKKFTLKGTFRASGNAPEPPTGNGKYSSRMISNPMMGGW